MNEIEKYNEFLISRIRAINQLRIEYENDSIKDKEILNVLFGWIKQVAQMVEIEDDTKKT